MAIPTSYEDTEPPEHAWPLDQLSVNLRSKLAYAASHFCRSALRCWVNDDRHGFYLNAGPALELAVKARLCAHGLVFLAPDNGWFKKVEQLVKDTSGSADPIAQTVGAGEAVQRLLAIEPALATDIRFDSHRNLLTIKRCNAIKHVGHAEPSGDTVDHAADFVKEINSLARNPKQLWGEQYGVATKLLTDSHDRVGINVERKITKARADQTKHDLSALAAIQAAIAADPGQFNACAMVPYPCPVCGSAGWAYGTPDDFGEPDYDVEGERVYAVWLPDVQTVVEKFECKVCRLLLETPAEVDAAGVPLYIENVFVDHRRLY